MAIARVDSQDHLQVGKIPIIDLRFFSQEDLNSLARCSDEFQPLRCDDDVVPKIDRSVFNESAGSRKQTYSRLRLARSKEDVSTIGRRRAGLLSVSRNTAGFVDDSEQRENNQIVLLLRELFAQENRCSDSKLSSGSHPDNLNGFDTGEHSIVAVAESNGLEENNRLAIVVADGDENKVGGASVANGAAAFSVVLPIHSLITSESKVSCENIVDASTERPRKRVRKKDDARRKAHCESGSVINARIKDSTEVGSCSAMVLHQNNTNHASGGEITDQSDAIDVSLLAREDPFVLELRKRTAGLENEAELLEFLRNLEGKWGSRRKKRKIVDASDFGKGLPKGWKLLLGVRKKEGRYSLDCRRYISPDGEQFTSCREVSLHLMSSVHPHGASQICSNNKDGSAHKTYNQPATRAAGAAYEHDSRREDPTKHSPTAFSSTSTDNEKQVVLFKVENPVKAQLMNLLECRRCSVSFGNKDAYVQHLLSFHQRNAKRCRPGKSIGEGVIIKDGKYVCQICHKVFEEKHRYNGHVGVHVRNFVKSLEALPDEIIVGKSLDPSPFAWTPSVVSEVEALVDNRVKSIPEVLAKSDHDQNVGSSLGEPDSIVENKVDCSLESSTPVEVARDTLASKSVDLQGNGFEMAPPNKIENVLSNSAMNAALDVPLDAEIPLSTNQQNGTCESCNDKDSSPDNEENFPGTMLHGVDKSGNDQESGFGECSIIQCTNKQNDGFETCANDIFTISMEHAVHDKGDKSSNVQESAFEGDDVEPDKGAVIKTVENIVVDDLENIVERDIGETLSELVQPSEAFPILAMASEKGEDELSSVSQKLENLSSFDGLRLDDICPSRFDFVTAQDSSSLPEEPPDLAYGADLEQELNPSVWDSMLPKLDASHQLTTVCVWCRMEFNHEGLNPETQSDSVGFMCPTCKAKISGQLSVLDNGLSMNADQL